MRASLPMYDWPEVRAQTDAFWAELRTALHGHGIDCGDGLDRTTPRYELWQAPDLILSQTCGWPLVSRLSDLAEVVAVPTYAVEGCGTGTYRSALIARESGELREMVRGRVAINSRDSLSGYRTLLHTLARRGLPIAQVGEWVETGSHRNSVRAVAERQADVAAIDAVSWQLALDHEPSARNLTVIGWSEELPALPFITSKRRSSLVDRLATALRHAIKNTPQPYLVDVSPATIETYEPVAALRNLPGF